MCFWFSYSSPHYLKFDGLLSSFMTLLSAFLFNLDAGLQLCYTTDFPFCFLSKFKTTYKWSYSEPIQAKQTHETNVILSVDLLLRPCSTVPL